MKRWMGGGVYVVGLILIFEVFSSCGGGAGNGTDGLIGLLDSTFGTGGVARYDGGNEAQGNSIALQSDGSALVTGMEYSGVESGLVLVRFTDDGYLDTTYGTGGVARYDGGDEAQGNSVALQADGKALVAGWDWEEGGDTELVLARFTDDGYLDTTYGTGGVARYDGGNGAQGNSVALQGDGKALVAGWDREEGGDTELVLVRFNTDGTLDSTFGTSGAAHYEGGSAQGNSMVLLADGKALVAGYDIDMEDLVLVRFNTNGALDSTFGSGGVARYDNGSDDVGLSVALQADGRALVAGYDWTTRDLVLVRFNANGTLDSTFGTGGAARYDSGREDFGHSVALQADGRALVVGTGEGENEENWDLLLLRFEADGTLDSTFGVEGVARYDSGEDEEGNSVILTPEGKALVAGSQWEEMEVDLLLVRFE